MLRQPSDHFQMCTKEQAIQEELRTAECLFHEAS